MGSRLYQLCREGKPSARAALARQYAVQALEAEEGLAVTDVQWTPLDGNRAHLQVYLEWQGEPCLSPWTSPGKEGLLSRRLTKFLGRC